MNEKNMDRKNRGKYLLWKKMCLKNEKNHRFDFEMSGISESGHS